MMTLPGPAAFSHHLVGPNTPLRRPSTWLSPSMEPARPLATIVGDGAAASGCANAIIGRENSLLMGSTLPANLCNYCGQPGNFRCVPCKKTYYCSVLCQMEDWKAHKRLCVSTSPNSLNEKPKEKMGDGPSLLEPKVMPGVVSHPQKVYLRDLRNNDITKGTEIQASVVELYSPGRFFLHVQSPEMMEVLRCVGMELQRTNTSCPSDYLPDLGEVCAVQFSMDQNWYRGLVQSVASDQKTANVLYIDFGNEEDVSVDRMRPLASSIEPIAPCAIECSVAGVRPLTHSWTEECRLALKSRVAGKSLKVTVVDGPKSGQTYTVDILLAELGTQLSAFLVDHGYATREAVAKKPTSQDIDSLVSASLDNFKRQSSTGKDENTEALPPAPLTPDPLTQSLGDSFTALVTYLQSPDNIICQKVENASVIQELQMRLRELCSQPPDVHCFRPAPGTVCCSQFSEDNQWYRAKVRAYSSEERVCVGYIDFGNSEEVDLNRLRPLSAPLLALPMQAIPCALAGVQPLEEAWSEESVATLRSLVSNRLLQVEILGQRQGTALVALSDMVSDPQANVAELLLLSGYAAPSVSHQDAEQTVGLQEAERTVSHQEAERTAPSVSHQEAELTAPSVSHQEAERTAPSVSHQEAERTVSHQEAEQTAPSVSHQEAEQMAPSVSHQEAERTVSHQEAKRTAFVRPQVSQLWSCAELPCDGQTVAVLSSVVENPGEFYCIINRPQDLKMMSELGSEVKQHCETDTASFCPKVGEPCCALFSGDCAWYRAVVQSLFDTKASVYFVDYGNSSQVEVSQLRHITPRLLTLPFQAVRCCLAGVEPLGGLWGREVLQRFQTLLAGCLLSARVVSVSERGYGVELQREGFDVATTLISEQLVKEKQHTDQTEAQIQAHILAQIQAPAETPRQAAGEAAATPASFPVDWVTEQLPLNLQSFQPPIAAVVNPSLFYLFSPSQVDPEKMQQMKMDLAVYCSTNQASTPSCLGESGPAPGAACCAKFSGDKNWYRAVVLESSECEANIIYCDHGNVERVPYCSILPIPSHLLQLPFQITRCALAGKEHFPSAWPDEVLELFVLLLLDSDQATVQAFDGHTNLLSVTVGTESGGGHLNTIILEGLRANCPPAPVPTLELQSTEKSTASVATVAPDRPKPSTTADTTEEPGHIPAPARAPASTPELMHTGQHKATARTPELMHTGQLKATASTPELMHTGQLKATASTPELMHTGQLKATASTPDLMHTGQLKATASTPQLMHTGQLKATASPARTPVLMHTGQLKATATASTPELMHTGQLKATTTASTPERMHTGQLKATASTPELMHTGQLKATASTPELMHTGQLKATTTASTPERMHTGQLKATASTPERMHTGQLKATASTPELMHTGQLKATASTPERMHTGQLKATASTPERMHTGQLKATASTPERMHTGQLKATASTPELMQLKATAPARAPASTPELMHTGQLKATGPHCSGCCCQEIKTKMAELGELMQMQLSLIKKITGNSC